MSQSRRSTFVLVSVVVHAALVAALVVASSLTPGLLPAPREVLAFHSGERIIQLQDVDLPAPRRGASPRRTTSGPVALAQVAENAPIVPPAAVLPETGAEVDAGDARSIARALEQGAGEVTGLGLPAVSAPAAPPRTVGPVRLHSGIDPPRKLADVPPAYPEVARQIRREGIVILEVVIDERGEVGSARVLRSVDLLDGAALEAVRRWRFVPARLNGSPIPIVMTVTVAFTLQP
jgi:periplasmic protein TonB